MTSDQQTAPVFERPSSADGRAAVRRFLLPLTVLAVTAATAGAAFFAGQSRQSGRAPMVRVKLVKAFPHDPGAFCQGLVVHKGRLLEGTGQYNESRLRLVDIENGKPVFQVDLPGDVFGEEQVRCVLGRLSGVWCWWWASGAMRKMSVGR